MADEGSSSSSPSKPRGGCLFGLLGEDDDDPSSAIEFRPLFSTSPVSDVTAGWLRLMHAADFICICLRVRKAEGERSGRARARRAGNAVGRPPRAVRVEPHRARALARPDPRVLGAAEAMHRSGVRFAHEWVGSENCSIS